MKDENKWVLTNIGIKSFLGVSSSGITVDLDHPVVVLHGPSGSGKSTIVSAIEWGLFGTIDQVPDYSVTGVGENNLTHRSIIHNGESSAEVILTFQNSGHSLIWRRFRDRGNPKPDDDELTCHIDGKEVVADAKILFGLTSRLYRRGIAPKQTTLRNLVHNERADRNEALDHLFGIESLNDLSVGFSNGRKDIGQRVRLLVDRYDRLSSQLRDPVKAQFEKRAQARETVIAAGASRGQLTRQAVDSAVQEASLSLGEKIPTTDLSLEDLRKLITSLREQADKAWARPGPQERVQRLTHVKNTVPIAWSSWQNAVENSRTDDNELKKMTDELGDEISVAKEVTETTERLETAKSALADANSKAAVLERAHAWLADHDHDQDLACPVCQRGIELSDLSSAINTSLQLLRGSDGAIELLEGEIKQCQSAKDVAASKFEALTSIAKKAGSSAAAAQAGRNGVLETVSGIYGTWQSVPQLDKQETAVYEILKTASEISPESADADSKLEPLIRDLISEVEKAQIEAVKELENASDEADKVKSRILLTQKLLEFLEEDEKLTKLDVMLTDTNLAAAASDIAATKRVEETVHMLAEVVGEISEIEANKITESISEPIRKWFGRISQHDVLQAATVKANVKRTAGIVRNSYEIRATDAAQTNPVPAGHNLSGGYEMVLAISALCAIQEVVSSNHNVGLFILDEPTESLDPELEQSMGAALGLHAPGPRTIITTNHPDFAKAIRESAGAARAKVIDLASWTVKSGTVIK